MGDHLINAVVGSAHPSTNATKLHAMYIKAAAKLR